jgi:hypothetical protein
MRFYWRATLRMSRPLFEQLGSSRSLPSGHSTRRLIFSNVSLTIGGFKAIDYFEDGSLYLLDVPGVRAFTTPDTAHSLVLP